MSRQAKPLAGIKVIEFAGLAPAPFAGMVLSDFGADVIRIDRPGEDSSEDILARGKRSIAISPKSTKGRELLLQLIDQADVLIDPFRPGVLEKLGLGPEVCCQRNAKLIYARLTGFRRIGPYAHAAGHDINYLALSGVLSMMRPGGKVPFPPLNLVADFAAGGLMCVQGVLMAIIERSRSGQGQVVEADMVTGTRYLSTFPLLLKLPQSGSALWAEPAGSNVLDGGAPFYAIYETKDGKFMSLGALEPRFYAIFLSHLERALTGSSSASHLASSMPSVEMQFDRQTWPELKSFFETSFKSLTRDEWTAAFEGTDSCVAPVLEPEEAAQSNPGGAIPSPTPSLSRMPAENDSAQASRASADTVKRDELYLRPGRDTVEILKSELSIYSQEEIDALVQEGAISMVRSRSRASKL